MEAAGPVIREGARSRQVVALLRLIRLENCLFGVVTTMIGYASARATGARRANEVVTVVIVGLAVAYGNAVNDLVDESGDTIAKPGRPIVSGFISRRLAWSTVVALPLAVMVIGAVAAPRLLPFIGGVLLLSTLYSVRLKGIPFLGNLSVAVLAGSTFLFGALARGSPTASTLVGCVLITLAFGCFELAKTIEDADADAAVGLTTAAHVLTPAGQRRTILILATAYCGSVIGLGIAYVAADAYWLVIVPVLPLVGYAVASGRRPPSRQPPIPPFIRASKALWCIGLVGLLNTR